MSVPTEMRCLHPDACPSPLRCHFSGACREAVADVWRSVAEGFAVMRAKGEVPKGWKPIGEGAP